MMAFLSPWVLAACQPSSTKTPGPSPAPPEVAVNRIVYVGADANVFTIAPDGADSRRLTGNTRAGSKGVMLGRVTQQDSIFYTWPTWSPNGKKLAVSQVVSGVGVPTVSLFILDASGKGLDKVYENDPQSNPIIAQGIPHYMYWSPDSQRLAFIASTPQGLTMFIHTLGEETAAIGREGPIYFKWSQDSQSILIHARDRLVTAAVPFTDEPLELASMSTIFRAPDLSGDGAKGAFMSNVGQGFGLLVGDPKSPSSFQQVETVGNTSALLWSPAGDSIAVADNRSPSSRFHDRLRIISADGSSSQTLAEEPILAFFWSPSGEKIAYVAIDARDQGLVWKIVSVHDGTVWELVSFLASPELLAMLTFFDQYAHSHSLWSPDSSHLVFAGALGRQAPQDNGATPTSSKIYVINTEPGSQPKEVAKGTLAFWSWN